MGKYSVIPSTGFSKGVEQHLRFLANVSVPASRRLHGTFVKALDSLADTAHSYPVFYKNYRKIIVAERYAVFFEIIGSDVYVEHSYDMRNSEYNDIMLELES